MISLAKPQVPGQVKHYLQFSDLTRDEYDYLLKRAAWLKTKFKSYETWHPLHDRTLAMIFEKHSTRTRLSLKQANISLVVTPFISTLGIPSWVVANL